MTSAAQMALRRIMEKYTANARFCIIANYTHKLSPALLSRCTRFRFSPLREANIRELVDQIIEREQVNIAPDAVDSLVSLSKGDMRRAINVLQACHSSSMLSPLPPFFNASPDVTGKPLPLKIAPTPPPQPELITNDTIYTCIAAPPPADIHTILSTILSTPDVTSCLNTINVLKASSGIALADIITALAAELQRIEAPAATRVVWMEGLADIEYRLAAGGNEIIQTGGLVGVVRSGCELMGR